jgi:chlorite dismutase
VGGKADLAVLLMAADLVALGRMHHELENCFPPGAFGLAYSFLSVTELPEYVTTDEDHQQTLIRQEKLEPGSEQFNQRLAELRKRQAQYEQYRLYPELPDWEVMAFYAMSKRRQGADNWYMLDFATRKRLMGGHARVGRKFAGRVSQLITPRGRRKHVTLRNGRLTPMAHLVDALRKRDLGEKRFAEW